MSIELITILLFGALILFLVLGLPLAFVLGGVGVVGSYFLWGNKGLFVAAVQAYAAMGKFTLLAIPLFVFMAMILERAGVADDLYTMMHRWMGPLRGGLAIGTVLICTIFAAMAGISGAATVSMGVIALPAMLKRKYDKVIAMGCISGGGALGILIPPSVPMILYATLTGESVGGLFAGGIFPGLLLALLFVLYIGIRCFFQPSLGPALPPEERATWEEKVASLRAVVLPIFIILMVLGSIYAGVCTPTESATLGVLGALISAAVYRKLKWTLIKEACFRTASLTTMIIWILIGSLLLHFGLHGNRSSRIDGASPPLDSRRPLRRPLRDAGGFLRSRMYPGSRWNHHDLHPGIRSGHQVPGFRSPLVRRPLHHEHGDGLSDPAFWIQSVLHESHCPERDHDERYLPVHRALRFAPGRRSDPRDHLPRNRPLASAADGPLRIGDEPALVCLIRRGSPPRPEHPGRSLARVPGKNRRRVSRQPGGHLS